MRSGQFCSCLTQYPFPFLGKPGSPSWRPPRGGLDPRWLVRNDDGSDVSSHDVNPIQLCSTGFPVGFRVTAFSPMLAITWLSPQVIVGDAVTLASERDGISPSRKLSCLGSVGIAPFFHLASRPQVISLFRLNESHTESYAKAASLTG